MIVLPAHQHLDHLMQIGDRQAVDQPDPPPNRRMNIPQQNLQLKPMRRLPISHHPDCSAPTSALPPICDGLRNPLL